MKAHPIKRVSIVGLTAMALVLLTLVGAQSSENMCTGTATIDRTVVTNLIAWIAAKTEWTAQQPPSICFVSREQLSKVYHGDGSSSNDLQIRALYSVRTHKVYLAENWNPADLHDRAAL